MVADLIKFHIDPHKHACIHYLKSRRHSFQFSKYEWVKTFDLHFWLSTFCLHNKSLNKEHTYFLYAYIIFVNTFAFVGLPSTTHHHPKNITLFILYSFYKISIDRLYNAVISLVMRTNTITQHEIINIIMIFEKNQNWKKFALFIGVVADIRFGDRKKNELCLFRHLSSHMSINPCIHSTRPTIPNSKHTSIRT